MALPFLAPNAKPLRLISRGGRVVASVFEDDDATATRNVLLFNAGLRTRTDAIMSVDRVDEEIAQKKVAEILKEQRGQLDDFPEVD